MHSIKSYKKSAVILCDIIAIIQASVTLPIRNENKVLLCESYKCPTGKVKRIRIEIIKIEKNIDSYRGAKARDEGLEKRTHLKAPLTNHSMDPAIFRTPPSKRDSRHWRQVL